MNHFIKKLQSISKSHWYWLFYIIAGLNLLASALYFQYFLDEPPCVVCIQIRLWFSLLIIISIVALFTRSNRVLNSITNLSALFVAIGLTERSYLLLGTERGFIFSDCGFNLGLPTWFSIDAWLPWVYRVETSCGYTPEILFGVTMAEMLMAMSVALLTVTTAVFVANLLRLKP